MLDKVKQSNPKNHLQGFAKLRHRESIDYPMLSVGVRFDLNDRQEINNAVLIVNALAARPREVKLKEFVGKALNENTIKDIANLAQKRSRPLTNICDDPDWRKEMVSVYVQRAIANALENRS